MSSASKSELLAEVEGLKAQLVPQLAADRKRVEGEGRPFDAMGWVLGTPDSRKYPAGPAFLVRACARAWGGRRARACACASTTWGVHGLLTPSSAHPPPHSPWATPPPSQTR